MSKLTTLEQLKMVAQRSKTEIDKVDGKVTSLSNRVDEIVTAGGEPNKIDVIKNNGTALDITEKGVDIGPAITSAVAAADHLTKKKVTALTDIDPTSEGVDKFIYLVPKTGSDEDDVYDEYMVLDGKVEHVGNTKVDLSDYAKKSELPEMATDAEIDAMLTEVFGAASTPEVDPQA